MDPKGSILRVIVKQYRACLNFQETTRKGDLAQSRRGKGGRTSSREVVIGPPIDLQPGRPGKFEPP